MLTFALFPVGLFIFNIILAILAQVPLSCLSPPSLARGDYFCTLSFVNHGFRWWRALVFEQEYYTIKQTLWKINQTVLCQRVH